MTQDQRNLVWVDLEMTGLEPQTDRIIEIATIVTDADLNILAEGPVFAIHQADEALAKMDAWNTQHHGDSGLIERVKNSTIDELQASHKTIEFLEQYIGKSVSPMCGNSICQDRRFMAMGMPVLEDWFHYRNLDVSTLKELAKRWYPEIMNGFEKKGAHRALDDIKESIAELRYYRSTILK